MRHTEVSLVQAKKHLVHMIRTKIDYPTMERDDNHPLGWHSITLSHFVKAEHMLLTCHALVPMFFSSCKLSLVYPISAKKAGTVALAYCTDTPQLCRSGLAAICCLDDSKNLQHPIYFSRNKRLQHVRANHLYRVFPDGCMVASYPTQISSMHCDCLWYANSLQPGILSAHPPRASGGHPCLQPQNGFIASMTLLTYRALHVLPAPLFAHNAI